MKKLYQKPLLIDLNEQTGLGACTSGSGANELCANGNVARGISPGNDACQTGNGATKIH